MTTSTKLLSATTDVRINIGSGLSGVTGWYNIDNSPTILLSRLPFGRKLFHTPNWPDDVRRRDVKKGLPFKNESVSFIYSSHTFEHFTWAESFKIAEECFRVLRPGGVLRLVVPDLRLIIERYLRDSDPLASHRFLERLSLTQVPRLGSSRSQSLADVRSAFASAPSGTGRVSQPPGSRIHGEPYS